MLQHIAQINCNRVYYIVYTFAQNYSIINVKWHILLKMPLKSDFISTFLDALKSPNDLNYFSLRWSKLDYSRPVLTLNTSQKYIGRGQQGMTHLHLRRKISGGCHSCRFLTSCGNIQTLTIVFLCYGQFEL